jgi:hypothetical protein
MGNRETLVRQPARIALHERWGMRVPVARVTQAALPGSSARCVQQQAAGNGADVRAVARARPALQLLPGRVVAIDAAPNCYFTTSFGFFACSVSPRRSAFLCSFARRASIALRSLVFARGVRARRSRRTASASMARSCSSPSQSPSRAASFASATARNGACLPSTSTALAKYLVLFLHSCGAAVPGRRFATANALRDCR